MDDTSMKILVDLILDLKKDVGDIKKDLSDTKEMTHANGIVLDEHQRRSEAAESRLDVQEHKLEKFMEKMEPVQDHVKGVRNLLKTSITGLKLIGIIVSLVATILGLFHHFSK
jgi:hypothetical protein